MARDTGALAGLYDEREMSSENVKDRVRDFPLNIYIYRYLYL